MRQVFVLFLAVAFALSFAGIAAAQATAPGSGQQGSEPAKSPASDPTRSPTGASSTDPSKPSTTTTAPAKPGMDKGTATKDKPAGTKPVASGAVRGQHKIMGEVTKIDSAKGMVTVKTAEGDMDLHFPPSALQGIKEGDRVEVQLAIRPAGATGASTKAPGGAKSGDAAKPKTQ